MQARPITIVEEFLAHVEVRGPRECWWWAGTTSTNDGYPVWFRNGRYQLAQRFAWTEVWGRDPLDKADWLVRTDHDRSCDRADLCPHRLCMNPDHMRPARTGGAAIHRELRRLK